ncbi:hypothetical protein [Microbacterium marmarense]|uniref:DUF1801 domain-containing protein n=1 Tax=Microbacterium marmarense TaxID=3122051 RepID=A0ABU8LRI4_9MICO
MEMVADDVRAFIDSSDRSDDLRVLDEMILAAMPGLSRTLWRGKMWGGTEQQIIGYGVIHQKRPKGADVEWFLVGLAVQKRHLSVYVNAAEGSAYLVQQRSALLGNVKVGAAAVTFAAASDLNLEEFRDMLTRARELSPDAT